jgi:hypothetical protein
MKEKPSKFADMLRTRRDEEPPAKRGRPGGQGKRGNPDYAQVTAYIPKTLHESHPAGQQGIQPACRRIADRLEFEAGKLNVRPCGFLGC